MRNTTYRTCQIVHPSWERVPKVNGPDPVYPSDYVTVRVIDTHGTWNIKDLLSSDSLGTLARLANSLERKEKRSATRNPVHKRSPVSIRHGSSGVASVG